MKKVSIRGATILPMALILVGYAPAQNQRIRDVFTFGSSSFDYASGLATVAGDPDAILFSGVNEGPMTLPGPSGTEFNSTGEAADSFVARWQIGQPFLDWRFHMSGSGRQDPVEIATLTTGEYLIMDAPKGPTTIEPTQSGTQQFQTTLRPPDVEPPNAPSADPFTAKLNSSGVLQWYDLATGELTDFAKHAVPLDDGGAIMLGTVRVAITFNEGLPTELTLPKVSDPPTSFDSVLIRYTNDGEVVWGRRVGGGDDFETDPFAESDAASRAALLPSGDILASGINGGILIANMDEPDEQTFNSSGEKDGWVGRWDTSGNLDWVQLYGGTGEERILDITPIGSGDFVMCGALSDGAVFPLTDGGNTVVPARGGTEFFVARARASDGRVRWVRTLEGDADERAWAVAVDPAQQHVFVAGQYASDLYEGNTKVLDHQGNFDGVIARYDAASGEREALFSLRSPGFDTIYRLMALSENRLVAAGAYTNGASLNVGGEVETLSGDSEFDGFVAVIQPLPEATTVDNWWVY